jgi:uncharacterized paraquat-inducible protein A
MISFANPLHLQSSPPTPTKQGPHAWVRCQSIDDWAKLTSEPRCPHCNLLLSMAGYWALDASWPMLVAS